MSTRVNISASMDPQKVVMLEEIAKTLDRNRSNTIERMVDFCTYRLKDFLKYQGKTPEVLPIKDRFHGDTDLTSKPTQQKETAQ